MKIKNAIYSNARMKNILSLMMEFLNATVVKKIIKYTVKFHIYKL